MTGEKIDVSVEDIRQARSRIAPHVVRTPMRRADRLSRDTGVDVWLKLEQLQVTGAFKARGAFNKILGLTPAERRQGVVAVSTGNHGRAVAYAARETGAPAVVCLSELVPKVKVDGVRAMGAEVVVHGRSQDEAMVEAMRLVEDKGLSYVSPFDDPAVVAGQGTIGLELIEDLPDTATVLIPLSGGGLFAGIARAAKSIKPDLTCIGISMERGAAMDASLRAGQPVEVDEVPTLADSLGGGIGLDNRVTFHMVRELIDEVVLLTEEEIADGMRFLFRDERLVTEGGAAVGVAALLAGKIRNPKGPVAVIVSGQNVDMDDFLDIVAKSH